MADTNYCLCCGADVPYNYVEKEDWRQNMCAFCGFTLDVGKSGKSSDAREGYVLFTDDSQNVRDIIIDAIRATNICKNIITFEKGLGLATSCSTLSQGTHPLM